MLPDGADPVPYAMASLPVSDRVAVKATAGWHGDEETAVAVTGVRVLAVEGRHARLAPWAAVASFVAERGTEAHPRTQVTGFVGGGVAFEVSGERVGFDASVPLVAVPVGEAMGEFRRSMVEEGRFLTYPLAASELGLTVELGAGHGGRVGTESVAPLVGWRWASERAWAEATVGGHVDFPVFQAAAGLRLGRPR